MILLSHVIPTLMAVHKAATSDGTRSHPGALSLGGCAAPARMSGQGTGRRCGCTLLESCFSLSVLALPASFVPASPPVSRGYPRPATKRDLRSGPPPLTVRRWRSSREVARGRLGGFPWPGAPIPPTRARARWHLRLLWTAIGRRRSRVMFVHTWTACHTVVQCMHSVCVCVSAVVRSHIYFAISYPAVSWQGLGESRAQGQAHALTLSIVATTKNGHCL
jgi:hypothetical protein